MFSVGDYIVNRMHLTSHVNKVYLVLKQYEGTIFYDIQNVRNKLKYIKVPLPNDFYIKLEKITED